MSEVKSPYGWKGYNVKTNVPMRYENFSEEFGSYHPKIEYYIRKRGDQLNHASNVKASMTEWDAHNNNTHINAIAEKALFLCQDGMSTKYPLELGDCWGALYDQDEHTIDHHHWPYTWSFCYYVKVSKTTPPLILYNVYNPSTELYQEMPIYPKSGDMFIFPSTVRHGVPAQAYKEERIMLAGNIWYNAQKSNFMHGDKKYNEKL